MSDDLSNDVYITLGAFNTEREAALAHDRAQIIMFGEEAPDLNFPPEESAHVVFPAEIMRKILAAKRGVTTQ